AQTTAELEPVREPQPTPAPATAPEPESGVEPELEQPEPHAPVEPEPSQPQPPATPARAAEPETVAAARHAPQPEPETVAAPAPAPQPEPETEPEGDRDPHALRLSALSPLHPKLVRRLKRELQEVQNIALDRVRRAKGKGEAEDFLPRESEIAGLTAAGQYLQQAFSAGVSAGAALADRTPDAAPKPPDLGVAFVADAGERVRAGLLGTLRIGVSAGEDAQSLSDRIGSVFGDVKGGEADDLAAGHLVRAYELGLREAWAAAGITARRWVAGREQRCPEARCRHNDAGGAVPLDQPFASGHEVPPVHVGCTCTTVPLTDRA
ncbi:MAG: hypothetical protein ACRDU8_02560, partial [Egibacteraceae bacterium]